MDGEHGREVIDGDSLTVVGALGRLQELDGDVRVDGVPGKLIKDELKVPSTDAKAHFGGLALRVVGKETELLRRADLIGLLRCEDLGLGAVRHQDFFSVLQEAQLEDIRSHLVAAITLRGISQTLQLAFQFFSLVVRLLFGVSAVHFDAELGHELVILSIGEELGLEVC